MNPTSDFDHDMRQLHASALGAVSPQTLSKLRSARHGASARPQRGRTFAWIGATACTAVLALVAATQLLPRQGTSANQQTTMAMQAQADTDNFVSTADVLDQNPDLYVWLGSDASLAME